MVNFCDIGSDSTATSMAEELRHVLSFYSEDKAKVGATCEYHWLLMLMLNSEDTAKVGATYHNLLSDVRY